MQHDHIRLRSGSSTCRVAYRKGSHRRQLLVIGWSAHRCPLPWAPQSGMSRADPDRHDPGYLSTMVYTRRRLSSDGIHVNRPTQTLKGAPCQRPTGVFVGKANLDPFAKSHSKRKDFIIPAHTRTSLPAGRHSVLPPLKPLFSLGSRTVPQDIPLTPSRQASNPPSKQNHLPLLSQVVPEWQQQITCSKPTVSTPPLHSHSSGPQWCGW